MLPSTSCSSRLAFYATSGGHKMYKSANKPAPSLPRRLARTEARSRSPVPPAVPLSIIYARQNGLFFRRPVMRRLVGLRAVNAGKRRTAILVFICRDGPQPGPCPTSTAGGCAVEPAQWDRKLAAERTWTGEFRQAFRLSKFEIPVAL